jgi:Zn ribbon nucleic-acid-binding protein
MPPKDPEARAAYQKKWREKNIEHVRVLQREYEERNRDKIRERARERYQKNREKVLARQRAVRDADPEAFKAKKAEQARKRRAANPEKHRLDERRRHIKNKYGLTLEEYDAILARGCAICGTHKGRVVGKRNKQEPPPARLCLDHDHTSGKVRDALCHGCNVGLGAFADEPKRLRAAAKYLETHLK